MVFTYGAINEGHVCWVCVCCGVLEERRNRKRADRPYFCWCLLRRGMIAMMIAHDAHLRHVSTHRRWPVPALLEKCGESRLFSTTFIFSRAISPGNSQKCAEVKQRGAQDPPYRLVCSSLLRDRPRERNHKTNDKL